MEAPPSEMQQISPFFVFGRLVLLGSRDVVFEARASIGSLVMTRRFSVPPPRLSDTASASVVNEPTVGLVSPHRPGSVCSLVRRKLFCFPFPPKQFQYPRCKNRALFEGDMCQGILKRRRAAFTKNRRYQLKTS